VQRFAARAAERSEEPARATLKVLALAARYARQRERKCDQQKGMF
jgi:hypothetical protein